MDDMKTTAAEQFGDAREEELKFLLEVERAEPQGLDVQERSGGPRRDMIAWLLMEGYLNGPGQVAWSTRGRASDYKGLLERLEQQWGASLDAFLGHAVLEHVRLSHKGRVRASELRHALQTGRIRDSFGILFDGRHAAQALRLAIMDTSASRTLAVAYLDLNGMKAVNDVLGHAAGDVLLRAYLDAVADALAERGEAFRIGGDEVLVLLADTKLDAGEKFVQRVHHLLAAEKLLHSGSEISRPSLCAGIVAVTDPTEKANSVRDRADQAMYRAKERSKHGLGHSSPRPSVLAIERHEPVILPS